MPPKPLPSGIPPNSWTREELLERWDGFWSVRVQNDLGWDTDGSFYIVFRRFLEWLSAEEDAKP